MSDDIVDELLDYEPAEMGFHTAANLKRLLNRGAAEIKRLRSELEDALDNAGYLKPQSAAYKRIVKGHK